jgi:hypothetical protein
MVSAIGCAAIAVEARRHRMRSHTLCTICWSVIVLLASGCQPAFSPDGAAASQGPEQIAAAFLEAVRTGNDANVSEFLTPLARERTAAMEMVVAPPGSETAKYQVRGVQVQGTDAQVQTDWTDLDTDGLMHTDEIVWLLRREREGWRIWGMTSRVFEDQEPITLNFENPQEMLERQQRAEEELARRERSRGLRGEEIPAAEPRR